MATKKYLDYAGLKRVLAKLLPGARKIWHGTLAEWEALSAAEKAKYDQAEVIDKNTGVPVVVDKVESGNLNPVTSNAVAEYVRNQNILDDWEEVTFTNGQYTAPYDGVIAFDNSQWTSTNNLGYVTVNDVGCANFGQIDGGTIVGNHFASMSVNVKKGDVVKTTSYTDVWTTKARWYKLRDYTGR